MSTPMLDNILAAFKGDAPSPLYGKPLLYLTGSSAESIRTIPDSVVEAPHGRTVIGNGLKIAHVDMRDNLISQFLHAAASSYNFAELDHANSYTLADVQNTITSAHGMGLAIIAKNPKKLAVVAHPNVQGIIAEPGAGSPDLFDDLRRQARKDGLLPVWFVFKGIEGSAEVAAAIRAAGYKGMGVSYSTGDYTDSHTVLLPIV